MHQHNNISYNNQHSINKLFWNKSTCGTFQKYQVCLSVHQQHIKCTSSSVSGVLRCFMCIESYNVYQSYVFDKRTCDILHGKRRHGKKFCAKV